MLVLALFAGGVFLWGLRSLHSESPGASEEEAADADAPPVELERDEDSVALQKLAPAELAVAPRELSEAERQIDRYLKFSLGSLGLAVAGSLLYAPLSLLSAGVSFYVSIPVFQQAYDSLVKKRRFGIAPIDAIGAAAALFGGFYIATALGASLYYGTRKLLLRTEDQSRKKLTNFLGEQPRTIMIVKGEIEIEIPFAELQAGDVIQVRAGQVMPVDGVIVKGTSSIDQHALTGESQPVDKGVGEQVFAATVVLAGCILVEVAQAGNTTVAAKIGDILNQTADYRAEIESRGERLTDKSALPLLGLGTLALLGVGTEAAAAIFSCNFIDNMRMAVPLSMLIFLDEATQRGILVKDGRALELLQQADTIVFDKTGTLTLEQPHVGKIHLCNGLGADRLLTYAAAAEAQQSHPVARAILQRAADQQLRLPEVEQTRYQLGYGIDAEVEGHRILVGSERFMTAANITLPSAIVTSAAQAHELGHSFVYVAVDGQLGGALELRPTVRPEIPAVIRALKTRGLSICIISGDHAAPTRHLAAELGIDRYFAEVLPDDKAALVNNLKQDGHKVCFVGDGINDSIALKSANASISLRGASTIATDTAQIVMMDGNLRQLPWLLEMVNQFDRNTRTSLTICLTSAALCVGGIFFLKLGMVSTIVMYNLSLGATVTNAMLPKLRREEAAAS